MALTDKLKAIADAIRAKTGKTDSLTLDQMVTEITGITTGSDDIPFMYGGVNAEKIAEYDETWTLADTSYPVGTFSSTSATTIKTSISNRFVTPTIAIGDKDIVVVQYCVAIPEYDGATPKIQSTGFVYRHVAQIAKRRTTTNPTPNTRQVTSINSPAIRYYNSSGVDTVASGSYGLYCACTAPTVASSTAASTIVRVGSPSLSARASTTYCSVANMQTITDCTWIWHLEIYLVDGQSTLASKLYSDAYGMVMDMPVAMSLIDDIYDEPIEEENEE